MKRSLSLLLAIPVVLSGCGGSATGERPAPATSEVAAFRPAPLPASVEASSSSPRRTLSTAERSPSRPELFDETGAPKLSMSTKAVVTCDPTQYAALTGAALVQYIQDAGATCLNKLYAGNSNSYAALSRANMVTVARSAASFSASYTGVDTYNLEALFGFLRAGYYVAYYYSANVGWQTNDPSILSATRAAIDAFVNNAHFYDASDAHGAPLREALTLVDSCESQSYYLPAVKGWLTRWNQTHSTFRNMRGAVNEVFQILYRGHYQTAFVSAVQSDTTLIANLGSFIDQRWMMGTTAEFLLTNAARELARFLQYKTAAIYAPTKAKVQAILAQYQLTDGPYMAVADGIGYYDNCADYGTCNFRRDLEARVLTINYTCSSTIRLRAQAMTTTELADSCALLQQEETYFHQRLVTNNRPIPGDQNTSLEVVIFDSSKDYKNYAGVIFQISTNNGGIYMEGSPDIAGNQARFYCYEAEWLRPAFEVWNLKHEYIHYLDGRFDMKGGFGDYLTDTGKTVWWIEGLAEYISHKDYYDQAITLARTKQYRLSQVFGNNYNSGQDLIYRWGYLAVRFMFENHRTDLDTLLGYFRAGNYTGYQSWLSGILYAYDAEWTTWLGNVQSTPDNNPNPTPNNKVPVAVVNGPYSGSVGAAIAFSSTGSYDPDGTIASYSWSFGDGTTSTQANPSKSYSAAGTYTVSLIVKDNLGASSVSATTTVTIGGGGTCTVGAPVDYAELKSGVSVCVSPSSTTPTAYFYIYVQPGATRLTATLSGGTGDANLFGSSVTWADSANFEVSSATPGTNAELMTATLRASGWYYISVATASPHTGTTLTVTVQ